MGLDIYSINAKNTSNLLDDRRPRRLDAVRVEDGRDVVRRQGVQIDRISMIAAKRMYTMKIVALDDQASVRYERRPRDAWTRPYGDF